MSARTLQHRRPARGAGAKATRVDLDALPDDDVLRELIEGEIVVRPRPAPLHQMVLCHLLHVVDGHGRTNQLGRAILGPVDVVFDEHNVAQPDLSFVPMRRVQPLLDASAVEFAPDLVVEVLSPATVAIDRSRKLTIYQRYGVKHYWILDPEERSLEEYVRRHGRFGLEAHRVGHVTFEPVVFPGLAIDLGEIWV